MADEIRTLTAQLAAEPDSLVFLELGEALRQRGRLDAAYKVARTGLRRYPELARAHDLIARILCDRGEPDRAFEAWVTALRLDGGLVGAHKGLGFLYYQAGDLANAEAHLAFAAQAAPEDAGLAAALARVRADAAARRSEAHEAAPAAGGAAAEGIAAAEPAATGPAAAPGASSSDGAATERESAPDDTIFAGFEGGTDGLLLVDVNGLRLGGGLRSPDGRDVADAVAAQLAGVSKEAARAARLLDLGTWQSVTVESPDGTFMITAPAPNALLLTSRGPDVPMGRIVRFAERAGAVARAWLERAL